MDIRVIRLLRVCPNHFFTMLYPTQNRMIHFSSSRTCPSSLYNYKPPLITKSPAGILFTYPLSFDHSLFIRSRLSPLLASIHSHFISPRTMRWFEKPIMSYYPVIFYYFERFISTSLVLHTPCLEVLLFVLTFHTLKSNPRRIPSPPWAFRSPPYIESKIRCYSSLFFTICTVFYPDYHSTRPRHLNFLVS